MKHQNELVLLKSAIGALFGVKVAYAAITPFSLDFLTWVGFGVLQSGDLRQNGAYTGLGYVFSVMYSLWTALTRNGSTLSEILALYYEGPPIPMPLMNSGDFAFTLWMKIPMLLADLATLLLVVHIVRSVGGSNEKALLAGVLWAASPVVFVLEPWNTVDIFPALLILLGGYLIYKGQHWKGSGSFALGTILRLSPLLVSWIYPLAYIRTRQKRNLIQFLAAQALFLAATVSYVLFAYGEIPLNLMAKSAPTGLIYQESLTTLGPYLTSTAPQFAIGLGITAPLCVLSLYYFTRPSVWSTRLVAIEIVTFFSIFFAVADVFFNFIMWMIPTLVILCSMINRGFRLYCELTFVAFLETVVTVSLHSTANGKAFLYVPNASQTMVFLSASLSALSTVPFIFVVTRSLVSAYLMFVAFEAIRNTPNGA